MIDSRPKNEGFSHVKRCFLKASHFCCHDFQYAKCCRWISGSAPVLYPGRHTPQGRRLAYRTSLANSTTHGSRWLVRVQTNISHPKQSHIVSGPQSLTMTQTCYHPSRFRNELRKIRTYYRSNTVYCILYQFNSKSQSITAIYQPAQQGHSAFSYATSLFHGTPDQ